VPENDFADALSTRALDTIDTVVATVNDKAIRPAIVAARAVVFGVLIAVSGLAVAVLGTIGLIRLLTDEVFDHKVWITYLVLAAVFSSGGAVLYSRRGVAPDA
jgi:hypothetical protein